MMPRSLLSTSRVCVTPLSNVILTSRVSSTVFIQSRRFSTKPNLNRNEENKIKENATGVFTKVKQSASDMMEKAKEMVGITESKAEEWVENAKDSAYSTEKRAEEYSHNAAKDLKNAADAAQKAASYTFQDNAAKAKEAARETKEQVKASMPSINDIKEGAQEMVNKAEETIGEKATKAKEVVFDTAKEAAAKVSDAMPSMKDIKRGSQNVARDASNVAKKAKETVVDFTKGSTETSANQVRKGELENVHLEKQTDNPSSDTSRHPYTEGTRKDQIKETAKKSAKI